MPTCILNYARIAKVVRNTEMHNSGGKKVSKTIGSAVVFVIVILLLTIEAYGQTQADQPKPVSLFPRFTYSGYVQGRYNVPFDSSGNSKSTAQSNRAILWLRAGVTDNIGVVFDISGDSLFNGNTTSGATVNNGVTGTKFIEQYVEYLKAPYSARLGLSRIPFGYEVQAGTQTLITLERSHVVNSLLPTGKYGYDHGAFGYYLPAKGATFAFGVVNGENLDVLNDSNHGKNIVSRLGVRTGKGDFGASYYDGTLPTATGIQDVNRFGLDALYRSGPYVLVSEYLTGKNGDVDAKGWYVTAAYQRAGSKHQTYVRYDTYTPNTNAGSKEFKRWSVGHSIYFSKLTKFTLEYDAINNTATTTGAKDPLDGSLTAQVQVVF